MRFYCSLEQRNDEFCKPRFLQSAKKAAPIKQIADMLGHTSINTSAIYTKVDTSHLASVALPFPGGEQ
jgi:integrase